jgi:hypothetical protein
VSSLARLVSLERARRADEAPGWTRVIVWSDAEEAEVHAACAEGSIRGNLIIRRIVSPPIAEPEPAQ